MVFKNGLNDVDILFICSATLKNARNVWFLEMQAHAFSNAFYVACYNRTGTEDQIQFLRNSLICDYKGTMLKKAGDDDEIITAVIDINEVKKSKNEPVFYRDRRPELYGKLSE